MDWARRIRALAAQSTAPPWAQYSKGKGRNACYHTTQPKPTLAQRWTQSEADKALHALAMNAVQQPVPTRPAAKRRARGKESASLITAWQPFGRLADLVPVEQCLRLRPDTVYQLGKAMQGIRAFCFEEGWEWGSLSLQVLMQWMPGCTGGAARDGCCSLALD